MFYILRKLLPFTVPLRYFFNLINFLAWSAPCNFSSSFFSMNPAALHVLVPSAGVWCVVYPCHRCIECHFTLHWVPLHFTSLHCTTLHCTLHYTVHYTVHYTTMYCTAVSATRNLVQSPHATLRRRSHHHLLLADGAEISQT